MRIQDVLFSLYIQFRKISYILEMLKMFFDSFMNIIKLTFFSIYFLVLLSHKILTISSYCIFTFYFPLVKNKF